MARYFQVTTPSPQRQIIGDVKLASSETGNVYNGSVVGISNNSGTPEWKLTDGTLKAQGLVYDQVAMLEEHVDLLNLSDELLRNVLKGKHCGVITGQFRALLSSDYFNQAPTPGQDLYDNEDGTITTVSTGREKIGRCIGSRTVGGSTTVYDCWFDFGTIHGVG